ncbi:phenylacetate--CoA ligase family protein [Ottowia thiooxydans]|uniref:phenylacetate--CoA ligase family protein n=1 Tax=Ottowia thiooxydans TaxID=219182 RepID=UPI000413EA20|nr:phenylacetate--CoA ligase family protein [Ottowia thiooxydans]
MHYHRAVGQAFSKPVFDPLRLQAATLDVIAGGHASASVLAGLQQQRLSRLIEVAHAGSALYRERLGKNQIRQSDWLKLPPVTRDELMGRFSEWVTDPELDLQALRAFTADPERMGEPWLGKYMVWESSGTSGKPGIFVQDAQALAVYDALEAVRHKPPGRKASMFGAFSPLDMFGLGDRYAMVTATGGHFASICCLDRLRKINPWLEAKSRGFSIQQPTDALVQQLNDYAPMVLATYPSAAAMLAEEAEQGRLRIRPTSIMTGGEMLSAATRARISSAFGAPVRNSYGASEFLPIAWECAHGHLHVNEDWLLLEPVDEQFRPTPPGEFSHTVLLTNLANHVQPLIRYNLGDQISMHRGRCTCGSSLPVIQVQGRGDDTFRVPGLRRGQMVSLLPLALCTVLEEECRVFDFQLEQREPSTLVVRLPLQGPEAAAAIERCRIALEAFALAQGAKPIRVIGEPGCEVPRGRSGKACRVALKTP